MKPPTRPIPPIAALIGDLTVADRRAVITSNPFGVVVVLSSADGIDTVEEHSSLAKAEAAAAAWLKASKKVNTDG